ncbi:DUF7916 family protein [Cellulosilyticum sp. I15G10I2]|uniref:DUF7916 family protein n=1 Tax=Cellulosilyticum sp. I15G10I2 TaxID=1892843 RepID=UPI00085C2E37|nr:hypothetical protein [Cellulosilyticum sp. I15G10I2]
MKRVFDLTLKDIESMNAAKLKEAIKASEGRTVMAEVITSYTPYIKGVSNIEMAASFGADMITLNVFDLENPFIFGIDDAELDLLNGLENCISKVPDIIKRNIENKEYIRNLRKLVGRFLGINLEPIPEGTHYKRGLQLNEANLKAVKRYGFDYIMITGNPSTGVNYDTIREGITLAKKVLGDEVLIIAGKMHGAGTGNIESKEMLLEFARGGADVVLFPAPGTVPGFDIGRVKEMTETVQQAGALAMSTIGTSQEGASQTVIENFALMSKMAGVDIQHIGDCGSFGMALPENIMRLSIAIRGIRHTYKRMALSINR